MLFYSLAGAVLASEIALPGLLELARPADATIMIRLGDVPDHLPDAAKRGPNWAVGQKQLLIWIPGLVSFLLTDGRDIRVQPGPGFSPAEASPFLTQGILGLLFQQGGGIVLRASAVETDRGALLFCGDSGVGKSTFAAAMAARGHRFVADDFCVVDPAADGRSVVHGDNAPPRLWSDAIDALDLHAEARGAIREGIQKFHVRVSTSTAGALPLAGIYGMWEDRRAERPTIKVVRGMEAVQLIRSCCYRPQVLKSMDAGKAWFQRAAAIPQATKVFSLQRCRGFDWIAEGMPAVEDSSAALSHAQGGR